MLDLATATGLARAFDVPRPRIERALERANVEIQLIVDGVKYVDRAAAERLIESELGNVADVVKESRVMDPLAMVAGSPCR